GKAFFDGVEDARCGERPDQLDVILSAGTPDFGDYRRGVSAYGCRPRDQRCAQAARARDIPEGGSANIFGVPAPATIVLFERIPGHVGDDSMSARVCAGGERSVRR